jgi:hypothetical protein
VFSPSGAPTAASTGADSIVFDPLVRIPAGCVAAAIERGGVVGDDLALRPTRIVVVGDPLFIRNGQLQARGNANREFIQNCVSYLSGSSAPLTDGRVAGSLVLGFDRDGRVRFTLASAMVFPGAVFLSLVSLALVGRRKR